MHLSLAPISLKWLPHEVVRFYGEHTRLKKSVLVCKYCDRGIVFIGIRVTYVIFHDVQKSKPEWIGLPFCTECEWETLSRSAEVRLAFNTAEHWYGKCEHCYRVYWWPKEGATLRQDFDVRPWCERCGRGLSKVRPNPGDGYKHKAVTRRQVFL